MNPWIHRYRLDPTNPGVGSALRDAALRVLMPAVLLWAAVVGIGLLIEGPLGGLPGEDAWSKDIQDARSPVWDTVTMVWSRIGNTEIVIATCLVAVALIWWRTRQWWYAVVPAVAITVQSSVFVLATLVVGRDRPEVEQLDPAPATSSYPSGHVGASTALWLSFLLMAQRVRTPWLRVLLTVVCAVVPLLVAVARFYRGMHHVSDCAVGLANGVVCAGLAWNYLRRDVDRPDTVRA